MKIVKGKDRIVILLSNVVIKIARIDPYSAIKRSLFWIKHGVFGKKVWEYDYEVYGVPHSYLFRAIAQNWHEFRLYQKIKHPFLVPTYFSFLGFFNIQKRGESFEMRGVDFWVQMNHLTDGAVWDDGHHYAEPANFSKTDGHLQIFDYGSFRCHRVIREYGEKIHRVFDFSLTKESFRN